MRWGGGLLGLVALGLSGCLAGPGPAPGEGALAAAGGLEDATPKAAAVGASLLPSPQPTQRPGLLVPLYERPGGPGWRRLLALKQAHPRLPIWAIANPDNGAPWGPAPAEQASWAALKAAGIGRLGYVSTRYGRREPEKVAADVARWRAQAPDLEGLFLDEWASEAKHQAFCEALVAQGRAMGFTTLVGNAGTGPKRPELEAMLDLVVAYEKPGLPSALPAEPTRDRQAMLAYAVPSLSPGALLALSEGSRWLYVTELDEPNPWATLSAHAEAMAEALDP